MEVIKVNEEELSFAEIIYVDVNVGNDTLGDGSSINPYKSIPFTQTKVMKDNTCIFIVGEGIYQIPEGLGSILTKDYSITYLVHKEIEGKVIFDLHKAYESKIIMTKTNKLIGIVFKRSKYGDDRVYEYFSDISVLDIFFYNCVFDKGASNPTFNPIFTGGSGGCTITNLTYVNCLFTPNLGRDLGKLSRGVYINCGLTQAINMTGESVTCLRDVAYNETSYSIITPNNKNIGSGKNPDGTVANIGVYGGVFGWGKWNKQRSFIKTETGLFNFNRFDNELEDISATVPNVSNLTSYTFIEYGMPDLSIIPQSEWDKLSNFEIITYTDQEKTPEVEVTVPPYKLLDDIVEPKILIYSEQATPVVRTKSLPNRQIIKPKKDIQFSLLENINNITLTTKELASGVVRIIFSVDGGLTWQTYNTITSEFTPINESILDSVKARGIKVSDFNTIGSQWNSVITTDKIRFAYYVELEEIVDKAEVDKMVINMDLTGRWKKAIHTVDHDYEYDNTNIYVTFKKNGSYKVNYAE